MSRMKKLVGRYFKDMTQPGRQKIRAAVQAKNKLRDAHTAQGLAARKELKSLRADLDSAWSASDRANIARSEARSAKLMSIPEGSRKGQGGIWEKGEGRDLHIAANVAKTKVNDLSSLARKRSNAFLARELYVDSETLREAGEAAKKEVAGRIRSSKSKTFKTLGAVGTVGGLGITAKIAKNRSNKNRSNKNRSNKNRVSTQG